MRSLRPNRAPHPNSAFSDLHRPAHGGGQRPPPCQSHPLLDGRHCPSASNSDGGLAPPQPEGQIAPSATPTAQTRLAVGRGGVLRDCLTPGRIRPRIRYDTHPKRPVHTHIVQRTVCSHQGGNARPIPRLKPGVSDGRACAGTSGASPRPGWWATFSPGTDAMNWPTPLSARASTLEIGLRPQARLVQGDALLKPTGPYACRTGRSSGSPCAQAQLHRNAPFRIRCLPPGCARRGASRPPRTRTALTPGDGRPILRP